MINNKVIIVGGDHHNGLNLARMLGDNDINVIAIIVTSNEYSFMSRSKFIKEYHIFHTDKEAYDFILASFGEDKDKPIIIPYSDGAAMELDVRLDEFKSQFYVPSINNKAGEIARLMDKKNQYDWAVANGIRMAKSEMLELRDSAHIIDNWQEYPCILKPMISAQGKKGDIEICEDKSSLIAKTTELLEKEYETVLIQPYLNIDYEIDVFGAICKKEPTISLVPTETKRSFPVGKGTNCFSQIITDENRIIQCRNIIKKLQQSGFYGLYDIELLVVNGEILLNEINYRNSGDDYMVISQKFYYPMLWINDCLGILNTDNRDHMEQSTYAMTYWYDYQHVKQKRISFFTWIRDVKRTSDFALYDKKDMKPVYAFYYYSFLKKMRRLLKIN